MAMTVRRLAQQSHLGLTLIAGRESGDRVINWAHAIELVDPTPYLSAGELVMTTGMNLVDIDMNHYEYVSRLSRGAVSALAFDTGTTFAQVPPGIIAAGDALGMPVLAVPPQTPFIAITRAVIDEVTADQLRSVQRIVDQQEIMVRDALRGGIPAIVVALSKALSATVIVTSDDGSLLAAAGSEVAELKQTCTQVAGRSRSHRGPRSQVILDRDGYSTLQRLRNSRTDRGLLAVHTTNPVEPQDRLLISHAVALVSLDLGKPAKVLDAEQRLRGVVTTLVIIEPAATDAGVLRFFGFNPEEAIVVLVMINTGPALTAEQHAARVLSGLEIPFLLSAVGDQLTIVIPAEKAHFADQIHRAVGAQLERRPSSGLSTPGSFESLNVSVSQARNAVLAGPNMKQVSRYAALGVFVAILGNRSTNELELLAQPLSALALYDEQQDVNAPKLIATLEAFLRHNGAVEAAADALGIHRHTLQPSREDQRFGR